MSEQNSDPKSNDSLIQTLSNILVSISQEKNISFILGVDAITPEVALSHKTFLPMFLLEAKEQYEKIYNKHYSAQELLDTINLKKNENHNISKDVPNELVQRDNDYLLNKEREFIFPLEMFSTEPEETMFDFEPRIEHLAKQNPNFSFATIAFFVTYSFEEFLKDYEKNPSLLINGAVPLQHLCNKWFHILQNNQSYLNLYSNDDLKRIDATKNNQSRKQ